MRKFRPVCRLEACDTAGWKPALLPESHRCVKKADRNIGTQGFFYTKEAKEAKELAGQKWGMGNGKIRSTKSKAVELLEGGHMPKVQKACRSAGYQPALQPITNRRYKQTQNASASSGGAESLNGLQAGSLRYGRLETCATWMSATKNNIANGVACIRVRKCHQKRKILDWSVSLTKTARQEQRTKPAIRSVVAFTRAAICLMSHVKHEGADYFVTFRLADSLPKEVLLRFEAERAKQIREFNESRRVGDAKGGNEEKIQREFIRKVERYLDKGAGACYLRRPDIANLVEGALKYFHDERYVLREWVVMPNHVHVLFWPMPNNLVSEIVKSWKQFTSLRAKRIVGLAEGSFWQREPFDHWVRNAEDRNRIARYIRNNPVISCLCTRPEDWRWGSAWSGDRL